MAVATRQGLIDYCLRELGEPVVEINVDEGQIEDRVDEALDFFHLYHYDGIEKVYMKQQIRASEMTLTTPVASSFNIEEKVTGSVLVYCNGTTDYLEIYAEFWGLDSYVLNWADYTYFQAFLTS